MSDLDDRLDEVISAHYKAKGYKPAKIVSFEEWKKQAACIAELEKIVTNLHESIEHLDKVGHELMQENESLKAQLSAAKEENERLTMDIVTSFGAHLVDNHEALILGGEDSILKMCDSFLKQLTKETV